MPNPQKANLTRIAVIAFFTVGIVLVIFSGLWISSFLAILGLAICFWAGILHYITPTKCVHLSLLNASEKAHVSNIERILVGVEWTSKGIYLPPKHLKNMDSSLVFIPKKATTVLPKLEELPERLFSQDGIFLTPPGQFLAQLFEQELKVSFTKTDLGYVQEVLPKLLIEDLDVAEKVEITTKGNLIIVEIAGHIFTQLCKDISGQIRNKQQVGCLIGSTIACILTKATGKPISIQNETCNPETKTTIIEYKLLED